MGNPREPAQPGPADSRLSETGRDAPSPLPADRPATRPRRPRTGIRTGRAPARTAHPGNADTSPRGARHRAHLAAYCVWKRTLIAVYGMSWNAARAACAAKPLHDRVRDRGRPGAVDGAVARCLD